MTIGYASTETIASAGEWQQALRNNIEEPIRFWSEEDGWGGDAATIEVLIVGSPAQAMFAGLTGLRLVQSTWAGVDALLKLDLPTGIPVARLIDPNLARDMAEYVAAGVLALHRRFPAYAADQKDCRWQPRRQVRADRRRVTFLGFGEMAQAAARLLLLLGFPVRAWARHSGQAGAVTIHAGEAALRSLLAETDILVNLLPLTPDTTGFLDEARLATLPHGACLLNAGRGAHIELPDLLRLLDQGRLGQVMLDVFSTEPLPPEDPLWRHPGVTITPHVAAATDPQSASRIIADTLRRFRDGAVVGGLVDRTRGY